LCLPSDKKKSKILKDVKNDLSILEESSKPAEKASCIFYIIMNLLKLYDTQVKTDDIVEMMHDASKSTDEEILNNVINDKNVNELRLKKRVFDLFEKGHS